MPCYGTAQMKRDCQAIGGDIVTFGKVTDDVQVLVVFDQAVVNLAGNGVGRGIGGQNGYQGGCFTDGAFHQRISVFRN